MAERRVRRAGSNATHRWWSALPPLPVPCFCLVHPASVQPDARRRTRPLTSTGSPLTCSSTWWGIRIWQNGGTALNFELHLLQKTTRWSQRSAVQGGGVPRCEDDSWPWSKIQVLDSSRDPLLPGVKSSFIFVAQDHKSVLWGKSVVPSNPASLLPF